MSPGLILEARVLAMARTSSVEAVGGTLGKGISRMGPPFSMAAWNWAWGHLELGWLLMLTNMGLSSWVERGFNLLFGETLGGSRF